MTSNGGGKNWSIDRAEARASGVGVCACMCVVHGYFGLTLLRSLNAMIHNSLAYPREQRHRW